MHKRINVTLPEETVRLIDGLVAQGGRSGLIDQAIKHYVDAIGRANLRRHLKEGAQRRSERDLALAQEWFAVDEEAWARDGT